MAEKWYNYLDVKPKKDGSYLCAFDLDYHEYLWLHTCTYSTERQSFETPDNAGQPLFWVDVIEDDQPITGNELLEKIRSCKLPNGSYNEDIMDILPDIEAYIEEIERMD